MLGDMGAASLGASVIDNVDAINPIRQVAQHINNLLFDTITGDHDGCRRLLPRIFFVIVRWVHFYRSACRLLLQ